MKFKIFCACAMFTFAVAGAPAQTRNTWTINCDPSAAMVQHIQNGAVRSVVATFTCTTTGDIGGAAFKTVAISDYEEASATLYKAWGLITVTLASGDQVYYAYQTTAPIRNGAMPTGQKTYQITGGTGAVKGISGSGTCSIVYPPGGGSVQACTGTYKLP